MTKGTSISGWLWHSQRSGGVMVMDWAVNSSSKYRVSISDVTWGLNGGMS